MPCVYEYETGTWTGALVAADGGTITIGGSGTGEYTKIGRQVTVQITMVVASVSSPLGELRLTGLPFTNSATQYAVPALWFNNLASGSGSTIIGRINVSESHIQISSYNGSAGNLAPYVQATTRIVVTGTYFVDE